MKILQRCSVLLKFDNMGFAGKVVLISERRPGRKNEKYDENVINDR